MKGRIPGKQPSFPNELIGEWIKIIHAKNISCEGLEGQVLDETKTTLVIGTAQGKKTLLKQSVAIRLSRTGKVIAGQSIAKRPEERMKG